MNKYNKFLEKSINNNYLLFLTLLIVIIFLFLGSISQSSFIYDGFHWGLVASNANDLLIGKLPYKDFFVHYGFLTVLIHAIVFKFFGSIFHLIFLTALLYYISIILIFLLIKRFTNNNYCYLFLFSIFFFQPFVFLPWHTYFVFFFSILFIVFYLKKNYISYFLFGLSLQLAYLTSESFKICSYLILIIAILILYFENIDKKNFFIFSFLSIITGYLIPLLIFLIYLINFNIYYDWLQHAKIPKLFLDLVGTNLLSLVFIFIKNYFIESLNIITKPYVMFGLLINFSCLIYIFKFFLNKKTNYQLLFISFFSIFLNYALVFKHESFRVFSGPIIGFIILSVLFYETKTKFKNFFLIFIFFLVLFSNPFEKSEANRNFVNKSIKDQSYKRDSIKYFTSMKFENDTWDHYQNLFEVLNYLKDNCSDIKYFYNFTSDHFYYLILSDFYLAKQKVPGYDESSLKGYYDPLIKEYDAELLKNLKKSIKNNNAIFIRDNIKNQKIDILSEVLDIKTYDSIDLKYSYNNKKKKLYLPKSCSY